MEEYQSKKGKKSMECSRRFFIEGFGMFSAVTLAGCSLPKSGEKPVVRFGLVTDCHYAEIPYAKRAYPVGDAAYIESAKKLAECVAVMNREKPDFMIELGDFKDLGPTKAATLGYLEKIETVFSGFKGPRYHVAGNHDFDCLTTEEFFSRVPNDGKVSKTGYYTFVRGGVTFIVMNACFDSAMKPYSCNNPWNNANVPPEEIAWLKKELAAAPGQVVGFCHQCLCSAAERQHIVKNAAAVRAVIEKSGKVKAVFTGHQHSGRIGKVNGVTYYSLRALVLNAGAEENGYALAEVYPSGCITVTGYRKAVSAKIGLG
jgi:alkaline phosphatase